MSARRLRNLVQEKIIPNFLKAQKPEARSVPSIESISIPEVPPELYKINMPVVEVQRAKNVGPLKHLLTVERNRLNKPEKKKTLQRAYVPYFQESLMIPLKKINPKPQFETLREISSVADAMDRLHKFVENQQAIRKNIPENRAGLGSSNSALKYFEARYKAKMNTKKDITRGSIFMDKHHNFEGIMARNRKIAKVSKVTNINLSKFCENELMRSREQNLSQNQKIENRFRNEEWRTPPKNTVSYMCQDLMPVTPELKDFIALRPATVEKTITEVDARNELIQRTLEKQKAKIVKSHNEKFNHHRPFVAQSYDMSELQQKAKKTVNQAMKNLFLRNHLVRIMNQSGVTELKSEDLSEKDIIKQMEDKKIRSEKEAYSRMRTIKKSHRPGRINVSKGHSHESPLSRVINRMRLSRNAHLIELKKGGRY